jgi:hypothetical protein
MCIGGSSKIARTAEVVLRPLHAGLFGSGSAGLETAEMVGALIRNYRMAEAVRLFLAPLNLDQDTFIAQQRMMESSLVVELANQMQTYKIDAEVLVAGCDGDNHAHLFRIDQDGLVTCHTDIGFVSIGSGGIHSSAYFMTIPYSHVTTYFHALYHTFVAKKKAEVDPYVGSITDMFLINRASVEQIVPETIAELEKLYAEEMERQKKVPGEAEARLSKLAENRRLQPQPLELPPEASYEISDVCDLPEAI